ncbi:MAG: molybdopterin-dependent oxidoreductase [Actinomycetota bacterium]|nr:molybdopterin-dependent oxidoreductase [Actinomycetota bacterium]
MVRRTGHSLRKAVEAIGEHPPPGPFRPGFWRSPLRGPWLTSVFGLVLLVGVPVMFLTGLLSYAAYNPDLGPPNDMTPGKGILGFYLFAWPTRPVWLYRLTQGVHVTLGLVLVPVVLAKLWSVIPKLFDWPPFRSIAQLIERLSLLLLVGGIVFEMATGILNIQLFYAALPFSFYTAHFYGAWVLMAAFVVHALIRFGRMTSALRSRSLRAELRTPLAETRPEPPDPDGLVASDPGPATISRWGLGLVSAGSLSLFVFSVGQTLGGPFRRLALLAPRGHAYGNGPNDFPVNKTAADRGISAEETGPAWRLELVGPSPHSLSRDDLLEMPQHTYRLPIACVGGWSTEQTWTGVRLADLTRLSGAGAAGSVLVESLERSGGFRSARLRRNQIFDPRSLLALEVNGADLSLDHGYPARVIVPANPGVHNTKWVAKLTFDPSP